MVKFRDAGPKAAYEIAVGVHDADEASELGLAVVESDPTTGAALAFGRYKKAPKGGPLGITVAEATDTKVVAGGTAGPGGPVSAGDKGDIINPNDPVIHGGSDEIHKDGAEPPVDNEEAQRQEMTKLARQSIEDAQKPKRKSSRAK